MTENDLLAEPLKGEWGFDGVVVSDWGAIYDGEPAARAALDLTMPGPEQQWREPLVEAVRDGRVREAAIDEKVRRILRLAARAGALDGVEPAGEKPAAGRIEDAAPLAREAAAAAAVLLRNDGILPLQADTLRRVAVIGPGAKDARALGGGSASVPLPYVVTPFAGLRAALDGRAEVVTAVGATLSDSLRGARADELSGAGERIVGRAPLAGRGRCDGRRAARRHRDDHPAARRPCPTGPRSSRCTPASCRTRTATGASA